MERAFPSALRRACDLALVLAFAAGLLAPLADQFVRPSSERNIPREFRAPAQRPGWPKNVEQLRQLPARLDAYYVDHFGLRDVFMRWSNIVKVLALDTSPTRRVVVGEDHWVFPASEGTALEDYRGALPLSHGALEAWRRLFERRHAWLAERGIEYLFVLVPYKGRLYPEKLPARYAPIGPTRADQLRAHLERTSDFRMLDLGPVLLAERAKDAPGDATYFPLGTHWTARGAHAAYVAMLRALQLEPLPREAFDSIPTKAQDDDWGGRFYMEDLLTQSNVEWVVRERHARHEGDPLQVASFHSECDGANGGRAIVFHDSFFKTLRPWMAEHFENLDSEWTQEFDPELVEAQRPRVVLQVYNEFNLFQTTPHLTREEDAGARERRFEASTESLWRFDPAHFPGGLRAKGELWVEDGALLVKRRAASELLFLPELDYPEGRDLLVRIEVDSPQEGVAGLYFATRLESSIERERGASSKIRAGRDSVVFELPAADFAGSLAFYPGAKLGPTRIHAIEVRAARSAAE